MKKKLKFNFFKTQMKIGEWVIFSLVFILFFITSSVLSQVAQQWVARYNGPGNGDDISRSIVVDGSGNVYVTGYSKGSGTDEDYCTIKYNSAGVQQWVARYNGLGNLYDEANSIAVDGAGNVYVTGRSYGSGTDYDYCTIKYNSSGVQQWVARYNGPGNSTDAANSIAVDGSGNVYVTGYSSGSGTYYDYCTIKYNSAGVQQWVARYNGPGNDDDEAFSIALDGSGNVYVTGYSSGSGTYADYCTIKYNSSGDQQWITRYNGPGNSTDAANSIAVDGSGNVYVTGYSSGSGTYADYCTIKYNSAGVQQWVVRYNGPGNYDDRAFSIVVDGSGNVYVTGYSEGSGTYYDYCTIKYNSSGVQQWVARYNGPGNDWDVAYSITIDGSGNVYVTGWSKGSGSYDDYCTIKYNSAGVQQWVARYNGPGNGLDEAFSIALDGSGNVYVTGWSIGSGTNYDYCTIKYSQGVGIKKISTEIPSLFSLSQNYPNPFNPITKIRFDLPKNVNVKLTIYDMLGREVETIVNEHLSAGSYEINWDGTKYTSGVYYYRLNAGEFVETKKMILVK